MEKDDEIFDFGFTIDDNDDVVERINSKAERIFDAIMPLLENLKKNPESETIKWPNRVERIDAFVEKLEEILNEEV